METVIVTSALSGEPLTSEHAVESITSWYATGVDASMMCWMTRVVSSETGLEDGQGPARGAEPLVAQKLHGRSVRCSR